MFLITDLDLGGAETQLFRIISKLDRKKFIPIVVSIKDKGVFGNRYEDIGVDVYCLNVNLKFEIFKSLFELIKIVRKENPFILQTYMYHGDIFGRLARIFTNIPFVISSIRTINLGSKFRERIYKLTGFLSDIITTNSNVVANYFIKNKIVKEEKVKVIHNGIDIQEFHNISISNSFNEIIDLKRENKFIWVAVGRLDKEKDYHNMIDAFKRLTDEGIDTFLFIAGEGVLYDEINNLIKEYKIEDRVRMLGKCDKVNELLFYADAYVLSSKNEGMPNSVIEACAMGIPIVATDVGGVKEIIDDGYNNFLCKKENCELLFKQMKKMMLLKKNERKLIGNRGKENIINKFEISTVVKKWEEMYMELFNNYE